MPRRGEGKLQLWEVAVIKAMLATGGYYDQQVLAHFTRLSRTTNHREIGEIRLGTKHRAAKAATPGQLEAFLLLWRDVDELSRQDAVDANQPRQAERTAIMWAWCLQAVGP